MYGRPFRLHDSRNRHVFVELNALGVVYSVSRLHPSLLLEPRILHGVSNGIVHRTLLLKT